MNSKEKMNLLQDIGTPSTIEGKTDGKVSKFIQILCYSGMEDVWVIETRVRIYKQLKTKTSQLIPLDKNSILQVIKRNQYQVYYWLQSELPKIYAETVPFQKISKPEN